ncbi:hypothetical protein Q3G72_026682 [Acer saccharum]|nr:hypothetical protein Q3G72_026682 [Acer saccharum]
MKAGEDLPFGFWLKAAAPAKKGGFWGRRSDGRYDHGGGRRFSGNNEGHSDVAKQVRDVGEVGDVGEPPRRWSRSPHLQPGKGDSSTGKDREFVEGDVSAGNGSIGKCPLDQPTTDQPYKDATADTILANTVQATTKMKARDSPAAVALGVDQGIGNTGEPSSAARAEMGRVTINHNPRQAQGSSGSWKRRARGVASTAGQAGAEARQGKDVSLQDGSLFGKRGLVDGGVPDDKKQRCDSILEDGDLSINELSAGRSLPACQSQ